QLQGRPVGRPDAQGGVSSQGTLHAEATSDIDGTADSYLLLYFDGRDVDRLLESLLVRDRAAELSVVVVGLPWFAALPGRRVLDWRILDQRSGRQTGFDGSDVDERFKRRTGLTSSLDGAVEFALGEVIAADHPIDMRGLGIEREARTLGPLDRPFRHGRRRRLLATFGWCRSPDRDGSKPLPERMFSLELHGGRQRGVDVEATLEHHFCP